MKKIINILLVSGVFLSGCKKSYLDVNQNPNNPTTVTPNVILSAALVGTASNQATDYLHLNNWMGFWSRSGNYVPDVQTETYNIANDYTDGEWGNIYTNLNSYATMQKTGLANGTPFYVGVAKTMEAFNYAILVDMYNNVPYSQALNVDSTTTPAYDNGQAIYNSLVTQLDSAISYFEQARTYYSTATTVSQQTDDQYDVMFGSAHVPTLVSSNVDYADRLTEWEKFANTEKLKLLIHQSQVSSQQGYIATELAATASYGYLGVGESASINPGYSANSGKVNPFYNLFYTGTGTTATNDLAYYRANTYAVNFYVNTGDVRQFCFYAAQFNGSTADVGSNYDGDPASISNALTAAIAPSGVAKSFNQDQLILSDFESLFLQAEATERGWTIGGSGSSDPETLFTSAVEENFVYLYNGYNPYPSFGTATPIPDADAYLAGDLLGSGPVQDANWDATDNKLELILTQKWAALNGINWGEAWTDYRRTGYPNTTWLGISHATTHIENEIPIRYLYPQSEYNTNPGNVPVLPANSQFTSKIFWNQ